MGDLNQILQGKTPVSFLQEVCARRKLTPSYDVLTNEGPVHEPVFVMKAQAGEFQGIGKGSSKKRAKHEAATSLIKAMFDLKNSDSPITTESPITAKQSAVDVLKLESSRMSPEPFDSDSQGNPIGELQEYTQKNLLRPPMYDYISEEGPPHAREFVCVVKLAKLQETAVGKSKKIAKRSAAAKLLQAVHQLQTENQSTAVFEDDDDDALPIGADQVLGLKSRNIQAMRTEDGKRACEFYAQFRVDEDQLLNKMNTLNIKQEKQDFTDTLAKVGKEKRFEIAYFEIKDLSYSGQYQCLLQMCTNPTAICQGMGQTRDEAKELAAHNALQYLNIMTEKT